MVPAPFVVIIDANLLYPFTLRDTLLRAAARGFFQLRWSHEILDEMERNLVEHAVMPADKAARLRAIMEAHFPEAEVSGYELLTPVMPNDEKDRHVVAAAVKGGAQVIATANLRHFAELPEGIEAQGPDAFLCNLFDLDPPGFVEMLAEQAMVRRVYVLLAVLVSSSACMVSEGTLQHRFKTRRAVLEQLIRMSDEDGKLVRIDPDFTWHADDYSWPRKDPGLTEARWETYRSLFRVGLQKVGTPAE